MLSGWRVGRCRLGFQLSGASVSAVATAAVNKCAPDLFLMAGGMAADGGSGSQLPSRGWSGGGEVLGGDFVPRFRRCVDACSGVSVELCGLCRSFDSLGSTLAQGSGSAGGRSGVGAVVVPDAGSEDGSVVAVDRSLAQVPAFVVGRLLLSGLKMLSFPGMAVACFLPLRWLAGGADRQVDGLFSSAVVLVPRLWLCVFQFVFRFVICRVFL